MKLGKYSLGIGDRFQHQGEAQLAAIQKAKVELGIDISPVWNKSNREHTYLHTTPEETLQEAVSAVGKLGFKGSYFVDADHINSSNVDKYISSCNFFTLDVADFIGKHPDAKVITQFLTEHKSLLGSYSIPGIQQPFDITEDYLKRWAHKFLLAVREASHLYRHIASRKGEGNFITEVSMDEVNEPQQPLDLFFILKAMSDLEIPVQTIAPKFTGRFNKGVDYAGDLTEFEKEFEEDLLVVNFAIKNFSLSRDLKLSIHSGSDKFSIYPIMGRLIQKYECGIHIKTAGTTWLEELTGLAMADEESLDLVKAIYSAAYHRRDELCKPYASVIDIKFGQLPLPEKIIKWTGEEFVHTLRHDSSNTRYNPGFRQLLHVAYKVAYEYGEVFTSALEEHKKMIGECVTHNLYNRHIKPLFQWE